MRKIVEKVVSWVVYKMVPRGHEVGINVICEQSEWDVLVKANRGQCTLIRAGIASEGEAERLARGTSGDSRNAGALKKKSGRKVGPDYASLH